MTALVTPDTDTWTDTEQATPYVVLLWNDPVNFQDDVVKILQKVLEVDKVAAETHMVEAEKNGRAAVYSGGLDDAVGIMEQLVGFALWATIEEQ